MTNTRTVTVTVEPAPPSPEDIPRIGELIDALEREKEILEVTRKKEVEVEAEGEVTKAKKKPLANNLKQDPEESVVAKKQDIYSNLRKWLVEHGYSPKYKAAGSFYIPASDRELPADDENDRDAAVPIAASSKLSRTSSSYIEKDSGKSRVSGSKDVRMTTSSVPKSRKSEKKNSWKHSWSVRPLKGTTTHMPDIAPKSMKSIESKDEKMNKVVEDKTEKRTTTQRSTQKPLEWVKDCENTLHKRESVLIDEATSEAGPVMSFFNTVMKLAKINL